MITSQDEPVIASVETLEMNVRKFDADWKSSGFSIPQLEGKFPRSRVSTYYLLEEIPDFTGMYRQSSAYSSLATRFSKEHGLFWYSHLSI